MRSLLRDRGPSALALGLVLVTYGTSVVTALLDAPLAFALTLVAAGVVEVVVADHFPVVTVVLRRVHFAASHRAALLAGMLVVLLVFGTGRTGAGDLALFVASLAVLAVPVVYLAYLTLLTLVRPWVAPPVEVRNLRMPDRFSPPTLPPVLVAVLPRWLFVLGVLPVLVVGAVSAQVDVLWPLYVALVAYGLVVGTAGVCLVVARRRLPPAPQPHEHLEAVSRALRTWQPEVLLYHSGSASTTYQVDTWLTTLERMSRHAVVLVRERHTMRAMQRTDVPVLCVPRAVDVMNLALPDVRVALYVSNVGNNIHLLREPRVKHVFVGHGDSDKVGSFNPFSRVYDEIWVAGRAGRQRYARARVGVRDEAIVEVGRPQVDGLRRVTRVPHPTARRPLTVLYLPTWEGWTDDRFQTSLTSMGETLVRRLLDSPVPVRVVYRPHPMTGARDPQARAADARVRAILSAAADGQPPVHPGALDRLAGLEHQLLADGLTAAAERTLVARWNSEYWAAHRDRHLVLGARLPGLFECFEEADLLVADVSGVVSDFVATGKPYVVANPKGLEDPEFRESFPTATAAYLLDPGCGNVDEILAAVTQDDPMAGTRELARRHLIGPDEPPAIVRWDEALDRLVAVAEAEWDGKRGTGPELDRDGLQVDASDIPAVPRPREPVDEQA